MTTATGSAEEVPFVRGMERAVDEDEAEKIVSKFRLDGWITERIRGIWASMHQEERGPADYAESDFERGVRIGTQFGGYREGPKGEGNLKAVILGCTITLLCAFVIGAWKLSNDSAAIRAEFTEWKQNTTRWMDQNEKRLDRLENRRP